MQYHTKGAHQRPTEQHTFSINDPNKEIDPGWLGWLKNKTKKLNSCCCHDDLIWILENFNTIPHFLSPLRHAKTSPFFILQSDWIYVFFGGLHHPVFSSIHSHTFPSVWEIWTMTDIGMSLNLNRHVHLWSIFMTGSGPCAPWGLIITLGCLRTSLHIFTKQLP